MKRYGRRFQRGGPLRASDTPWRWPLLIGDDAPRAKPFVNVTRRAAALDVGVEAKPAVWRASLLSAVLLVMTRCPGRVRVVPRPSHVLP